MKGHAPLMSSASDDWFTPELVGARLDAAGMELALDPCAHPESPISKRARETYSASGLDLPWPIGAGPNGSSNLVFVNPPYSAVGDWALACREHGARGGESILLVPARTDTRWWHASAPHARCIAFWRGRMKFGRPGGAPAYSAPFPSALVYFGTRPERFALAFGDHAWLVRQGPFAF